MPALVTYGFKVATVNVDPPSLGTGVEGSNAVTVPGVKADDILLAVSPWGVGDDHYTLKRAAITALDTVTLEWSNQNAGTINPAALNMTFVWVPKPKDEVGFPGSANL